MIQEDEKAPSVFTEAGEMWLSEMVEALREGDYEKSAEIGHHESWGSINHKDGVVPNRHPEFGRLVDGVEEQQYLLISTHSESKDVTEKRGPSYRPSYGVENFGKVRIYNEAVARNVEEFFVPITGWDGENFRWVTTAKASTPFINTKKAQKADSIKQELEKIDDNWVIYDEEAGDYDGRSVLIDYGLCWYDGEWTVSESQIFN
jgi:hypothetical protein